MYHHNLLSYSVDSSQVDPSFVKQSRLISDNWMKLLNMSHQYFDVLENRLKFMSFIGDSHCFDIRWKTSHYIR